MKVKYLSFFIIIIALCNCVVPQSDLDDGEGSEPQTVVNISNPKNGEVIEIRNDNPRIDGTISGTVPDKIFVEWKYLNHSENGQQELNLSGDPNWFIQMDFTGYTEENIIVTVEAFPYDQGNNVAGVSNKIYVVFFNYPATWSIDNSYIRIDNRSASTITEIEYAKVQQGSSFTSVTVNLSPEKSYLLKLPEPDTYVLHYFIDGTRWNGGIHTITSGKSKGQEDSVVYE